MPTVLPVLLFVLALLAVFAVLFWAIIRAQARHRRGKLRGLKSMRVADYRPMTRLLEEADFEFLKAQPGYTALIGRKLRSRRRKIFGLYLQAMRGDFSRLHETARMLCLAAPEERSDLVQTLLRQRLAFEWAMTLAHWQLAWYAIGIGTVDGGHLVRSLREMQERIRDFSAVPAVASNR